MSNISSDLKISASILAADFRNLEAHINEAEIFGCDEFHFDVMDGNFVPEISMGPIVLKSLKNLINLPLEIHLMVDDPFYHVDSFADIGVDIITFHIEACKEPNKLINKIKSKGIKVGIAKNPSTSIDRIDEFLEEVDRVLIMCVEPGFSGQKFNEKVVDSIIELDNLLLSRNIRNLVDIAVDGGINSYSIKKCKEAGAQIFVSGSSIFWEGDVRSNIISLKNSLRDKL
ncbi:MAG: ribulose-phosphate 3-epimerase [Chloroflexi bacterium]|nr:ribulose-phosphate 3-epimerase [Chloroflexota bacterium]|tara:strand:+ start:12364 stop:13050 length:687 start_codon:yes stop_codon:yes gene_type:complete